MIRSIFRFIFIMVLCVGLLGALHYRLELLHNSNPDPTLIAGKAEDEQLFFDLIEAGLLVPQGDGGIERAPRDLMLLQDIEGPAKTEEGKKKRALQRRLVKALDYSAVGSIVRQQVDLWNQTRRIVAIRDDRPQDDEEVVNYWSAYTTDGRPLSTGHEVPEIFGFVHDGVLKAGFADWLTVPEATQEVVFRTKYEGREATTLKVQVVGQVTKAPPGSSVKKLEGRARRWTCTEEAAAQIVTMPVKPGDTISLTAVPSVNCSVRIHGLAIRLSQGPRGGYERYSWKPVKRASHSTGRYAILTADGVYLTDDKGSGKPTKAAFELGLLPIVGTGPGDNLRLSGLLARSTLPREGILEVRLTIHSEVQKAAQGAVEWGMMGRAGGALSKDRFAKVRRNGLVALDAKTGAVLGVGNWPTVPPGVHPWDYTSFPQAFPSQDPTTVISWQIVDQHNTPGSTFKPIVSMALMLKMVPTHPEIKELMIGIPAGELGSKLGLSAGAGSYRPPGAKKDIKNFGGRSLGSYSGSPLRDTRCGEAVSDPNIGLRQMVKHSVNHWFARMAVIMDRESADRYMEVLKASNGEGFPAPETNLFAAARYLGVNDLAELDLGSNVPEELGFKRLSTANAKDVLYSKKSLNALGGMTFNKRQRGVLAVILFTLAQNGMGQSLSAAPLHMAQATSAIPTGTKVTAHLISAWGPRKLNPPPPEQLAVDPQVISYLRQGMKAVPENGTAAGAFRQYPDFRCRSYGKTGTADVSKGAGYNTGWFVGWRDPSPEPTGRIGTDRTISYACMMTHAAGAFRFGGSACAPVVAKMLDTLEKGGDGGEEKKEKKETKEKAER